MVQLSSELLNTCDVNIHYDSVCSVIVYVLATLVVECGITIAYSVALVNATHVQHPFVLSTTMSLCMHLHTLIITE